MIIENELVQDLKKTINNYSEQKSLNPLKVLLFQTIEMPYCNQAKWFMKQLNNLENINESNSNIIQKLLVLLFSLKVEKNWIKDEFTNKINEVREKLLQSYSYSNEDDEKTEKFEELHKESITDAVKARENQYEIILSQAYGGGKSAHSQYAWLTIVDTECKKAKEKGYSFPIIQEIKTLKSVEDYKENNYKKNELQNLDLKLDEIDENLIKKSATNLLKN